MPRLLPAALILTLLAGCSETASTIPCPGSPVATLHFDGTLSQVGCAAGEPTAGANTLFPPAVSFTGTLSFTATGSTAALCHIGPGAEPLVGTQVADVLEVSLDTRGALLGGCNAACAVTVHQQVAGTLLRDPGGLPSGFTGTLLDQETQDGSVTGASCAPCTTPCQATYTLTAVPVPR